MAKVYLLQKFQAKIYLFMKVMAEMHVATLKIRIAKTIEMRCILIPCLHAEEGC